MPFRFALVKGRNNYVSIRRARLAALTAASLFPDNREAEIQSIPNDSMNPLFAATVQATEEAIINALVAGRDMTGNEGHVVPGIDHEALQGILRQHGRLTK